MSPPVRRAASGLLHAVFLLLVLGLTLQPLHARVPWPAPDPGTDTNAYHEYLFLDQAATPGTPNDYTGGNVWKYSRFQFDGLKSDSEELFGVKGMSVDTAWTMSTGRPDVVIAVLDSGIRWETEDLSKKAYLNTGELPLPEGSSSYDANDDGVVNVVDYEDDPDVSDVNGNGIIDAGDLIRVFSDGVDDDNNGYTDDISGWNFLDDTNNPFDEVDHGHGTGEAEDSTAEAANGAGFPGTCPNCQFLPLRVGQSFIAHSVDYTRAVTYAVDNEAALVQEALGTVDAVGSVERVHRYAWENGVPVVASSADEAAQHHNPPAARRYTIPVNSVTRAGTPKDDTDGLLDPSYLYLQGCTNFGTYLWVSVSGTSCSSEATGRSAGIVGLLQSHARNQAVRGIIQAHPDSGSWPNDNALSPAEVRGLLQQTADDVAIGPESAGAPLGFTTDRYPTTPGWDPYTGSGRINAAKLLKRVRPDSIPPEVVIHDPRRWAPVTPGQPLEITATMSAWRNPSGAGYELQLGCTNHPTTWQTLQSSSVGTPEETLSYTLDYAQVNTLCSDLGTPAAIGPGRLSDFPENQWTVLVRLRVEDARGNVAIDRRTLVGHDDSTLKPGWPIRPGGSVESTPLIVDLNGDARREVVVSTSSGAVHVYGSDGSELPGWPVRTAPHPAADRHGVNESLGIRGDPIRMSGNSAGPTVGDLEGDGDREVLLATLQGRVFAWHHDGRPVAGFPLTIDFSFSQPSSIRDEHNTVKPGIQARPVLQDMNGDGDQEIVVAALDRHLYAWHHDGSPVVGYPVLLADRSQVDVDPADHTVSPKSGVTAFRGAQINAPPAPCDLNGDGRTEFVLGTTEHYEEPLNVSLRDLNGTIANVIMGGGQGTANGRLFARGLSGASLSDSWPVRVPNVIPETLPYVGEGITGSPACDDVDNDGRDEVTTFAFGGPVMVFDHRGKGHLGTEDDSANANTVDSGPIRMAFTAGSRSNVVDTPHTGFAGSPTVGSSDTTDVVAAPTAGMRRLVDIAAPGHQVNGQDLVGMWDANRGTPLPGSPFPIEDFQFLTRQSITNVAGSGHEDLVAVSGGGSLHAWNPRTGAELPGFPKTTGHWMLGTPRAGDFDDDGREELVATTRDGWVWAWDLEALDFVEYLDTGPATFADTVTLANAHLGDTEGQQGPVQFQAGLPAIEVGLSATTSCDTPPSAPPAFEVASLGPDHPRSRAASTGGFAVDLEVVPDTVPASCVRITIDRTQAPVGTYVPVRWNGTNGGWEALPSGSVVSRTDGRVTFVPDHFSTFAVVQEGSLSGGGGDGGSCLIERTAPADWTESLRALRDDVLGSSLGRWLTRLYYRL